MKRLQLPYPHLIIFVIVLLSLSLPTASQDIRPMILPVAQPPAPDTWLFGQTYGNSTGAFNFGQRWYRAGQGLHFGIDLVMPCGTPLVATADGTVVGVDDLSFGSAPHNLLIRHDAIGVITLYGHLLQKPDLTNGQQVRQGDVVGFSGDPDETCVSRPHLHLEVRTLGYVTALNPIPYMNANWDMLTLVGPFGYPIFQQDLFNAHRWQYLDDQPDVNFGGAILNAYTESYPPARGETSLPAPVPFRQLPPVSEMETWEIVPLAFAGCCPNPRWNALAPQQVLVRDGAAGQLAYTIVMDTTNDILEILETPPPENISPDATHQWQRLNDTVFQIQQLTTQETWQVDTQGNPPSINTNSTRLLWLTGNRFFVPGDTPSPITVWVSDMRGGNAQAIASNIGMSARWLDADRILITRPVADDRMTTVLIHDLRDGSQFELGTWRNMRQLNVSPGGERLLFYVAMEPDPQANGVFMIETQAGASATPLPWFGAWRWRDASSIFLIPFDPNTNLHQLQVVDLMTGDIRTLVEGGFTVANGDWQLAPDGSQIAFLNAPDRTVWLMRPANIG